MESEIERATGHRLVDLLVENHELREALKKPTVDAECLGEALVAAIDDEVARCKAQGGLETGALVALYATLKNPRGDWEENRRSEFLETVAQRLMKNRPRMSSDEAEALVAQWNEGRPPGAGRFATY